MCSDLPTPETTRAAKFWTCWRAPTLKEDIPVKMELQLVDSRTHHWACESSKQFKRPNSPLATYYGITDVKFTHSICRRSKGWITIKILPGLPGSVQTVGWLSLMTIIIMFWSYFRPTGSQQSHWIIYLICDANKCFSSIFKFQTAMHVLCGSEAAKRLRPLVSTIFLCLCVMYFRII